MSNERRRWIEEGETLMPWEPIPTGVRQAPATVSENAQARDVLLVDRHGQPLIVREQRPVGFRKP